MTQQECKPSLTIPSDQPLIGIPFHEDGREVIRYFPEEALVNHASSSEVTKHALRLAGAWSDLSWEVMERELDTIRHQSTPTPPIDL